MKVHLSLPGVAYDAEYALKSDGSIKLDDIELSDENSLSYIMPSVKEAETLTQVAKMLMSNEDAQRVELPGVVAQGRFFLPTLGVTALWGPTSSGKTVFSTAISRALNHLHPGVHKHLVYGEPQLTSPDGTLFVPTAAELAIAILEFLASPSRVLIADSFRTFVYASTGATGKGGMNMGLFTDLTLINQICAILGKSLVTVINPLTSDEDAMAHYRSALEGSVDTCIEMVNPMEMRYVSRLPFWKRREVRSYRIDPSKAGSPELVGPPEAFSSTPMAKAPVLRTR